MHKTWNIGLALVVGATATMFAILGMARRMDPTSTAQYGTTRGNETALLPFGVEVELILQNPRTDASSSSDVERIHEISRVFEQRDIPCHAFASKKDSFRTQFKPFWKVVLEKEGIVEIVSPLSPSLETLKTVIQQVGQFPYVELHPTLTSMHVSVDARNRTVPEVRRLYKNYIALEGALDEIRVPEQRADQFRKSKSLARHFASIEEAFEELDDCDTFRCLRIKAQPFDQRWIYQMTLRAKKINARSDLALQRFEFRGQQAELDETFVVAWTTLVNQLVQRSFEGVVLEASLVQTVDGAWNALFGILVPDERIRLIFEERRKSLKRQ